MCAVVRLVVIALVVSCGLSVRAAAAATCPVAPRYLVKTAEPRVYAVSFRTYQDGVEDVALNVYAGDDTYGASVRDIIFAQDDPRPGYAQTSSSGPFYLKFPDDAAPEFISVAVDDPSARAPDGCTGTIVNVARLARNRAGGPTARRDERDATRAAAGYGPGVPLADVALLPRGPKSQCAQPYSDATVRALAQPAFPSLAALRGEAGDAQVVVDLDAGGSVVGAHVIKSTGWSDLDQAARDAASRTTYRAQVFRCASVAGSYLFVTDFR